MYRASRSRARTLACLRGRRRDRTRRGSRYANGRLMPRLAGEIGGGGAPPTASRRATAGRATFRCDRTVRRVHRGDDGTRRLVVHERGRSSDSDASRYIATMEPGPGVHDDRPTRGSRRRCGSAASLLPDAAAARRPEERPAEIERERRRPPLYANGIDALDPARYLLAPMQPGGEVAALARNETTDPEQLASFSKATSSDPHLGLPFDVDPLNLAQAGWGVVFSADEDSAVKAALTPLLAAAEGRVTDAARLHQLDYDAGESRRVWLSLSVRRRGRQHRPGHGCRITSSSWAARRRSRTSSAGSSPSSTPSACCRSTRRRSTQYVPPPSVVASERRRDQATFAQRDVLRHPAPVRSGDAAERGLLLVEAALRRRPGRARRLQLRDDARPTPPPTRALTRGFCPHGRRPLPPIPVLRDPRGRIPARRSEPAQPRKARSCARTGPAALQSPASASPRADLLDDARRREACSRSTSRATAAARPSTTASRHNPGEQPPKLADAPLRGRAAAAPARASRAAGSALGCIAHVERAWGASIQEAERRAAADPVRERDREDPRRTADRAGPEATSSERYAALSVALAGMLEQVGYGNMLVPDAQLASAWIQRNDAEGYALFGDLGRPKHDLEKAP